MCNRRKTANSSGCKAVAVLEKVICRTDDKTGNYGKDYVSKYFFFEAFSFIYVYLLSENLCRGNGF